jgi:hypothetical protein
MSLSGKTNIKPVLWGPYLWETIHFVAFGYPKEPNERDKQVYFSFYENMMQVLPCDKCTISAQELFKTSDIKNHLGSREDLIEWTYKFHRSVNRKLGKKSPTFKDFMYNFTNRPENGNKRGNNYYIIAIGVLMVCLLFLIMRCTLNIL